jgi:hypothetical protein
MIDDTGDRVSTRAWVDGYSSGEEIEVIDPLTGEKGWCYLLYFASSPPSKASLSEYLRFNYENNEDISDYRHTTYLKTKDGKRGVWMESMSVPVAAGGSGRNVLDRMKCHMIAKLLFGSVKIRFSEEVMGSNILAYKSGPVRVLRRAEQYAKVGKLKLLRAVADATQYRNMMIIPTTYQIPFRMDRIVTKLVIHSGFDYNEELLGAMIYNSDNPEGFIVNGKMDDHKRNMNTEADKWTLLTGPSGTYMSRLIQEGNLFKYAPATTQLIDDVTALDPPESVPGCIGYAQWILDASKIPRGVYTLYISMYWLPNYRPGDEKKYLGFVDNPVRVRAGSEERANLVFIKANMGDVYEGGWMK